MTSTTKPRAGNDLPGGSSGVTLADANFIRNALYNLNTASSTYGIVATGTTQATAVQLNSVLNQVDTTAANTGVNLPYSGGKHDTPYQFCIIINNGASTLSVYSAQNQTDTINGTAGATAFLIAPGATALFNSAKVGSWFCGDGVGPGVFTSITDSGNLIFTAIGAGVVQKIGTNARAGTVTLTGTTAVTVSNTSIATSDVISFSLATVGGTVGAVPSIKTITVATGFTVAGTAGDTSTYNWAAQATAP